MEISSNNRDTSAMQSDEIRQAVLLKRALKIEQAQQLALIESAQGGGQSVPLDTRLIGRMLNEKV